MDCCLRVERLAGTNKEKIDMALNPLRRTARSHQGFPVLPGSFPFLGHLPAIVTDLPNLIEKARRDLGDFFWIDFGFAGRGPELMCLHTDALSLLQNKVTKSSVLNEVATELLKGTMVSEDGPEHRSIRLPLNAAFQPGGLNSAAVGPMFAELIERRMNAWGDQREVCVLRETRELVLPLIFRMLGVQERDLATTWEKNYQRFFLLVIAPPIDLPGMPRPRGRKARDWIDDRLRAMIEDVRARPDATGLLPVMMRSMQDQGAQVSESRLLANLRFIVLAGHETSATTMANMVLELARRPQMWDALCDEAAQVGRMPQSPADLKRFPYAEAVFRETLRCRPIVAITRRRTCAEATLGGRTVPADTTMAVPIIHLSRHPDLFERPNDFLVERWLGRTESIKPFERVQFGEGPHFCLGYHLAWLEIVQFGVALALTMRARGLRPHLRKDRDFETRRYYPTAAPSSRARVVFA
jgi:cytochrome P450